MDVTWADLWVALAAFGITFVLFPTIELGWSYLRAPRRIAEDEVVRLTKLLAAAQEKRQPVAISAGIEKLFITGRGLRNAILEDQTKPYVQWQEQYTAWTDSVYEFVTANISHGKAVYILSAEDHRAIHISVMKGEDRLEKTSLLQRVDAILERMGETAGQY